MRSPSPTASSMCRARACRAEPFRREPVEQRQFDVVEGGGPRQQVEALEHEADLPVRSDVARCPGEPSGDPADSRLVLDLAECPGERLLVLGNHSALMTQRPRDHLPPRGWLPR